MRRYLALAFFSLFSFAAAAQAEAKPSVAILGLEVLDAGSGVDEATTTFARDLTQALRQRASTGTGPYQLAPNSDKDLLEMKLLSDCADEGRACMADIGKELASDRLLYGKVEKKGGGYQVSLKLLNVAGKSMERTSSDVIALGDASEDGINRWGRALYNRLTGIPDSGTLVVRANVDSGSVYINGEMKGTLAGGTLRVTGVKEGTVQIAIESGGHTRYEGTASVNGGEDTEHEATLESEALGGVVAGGGTVSTTKGRPGKISRVLFWTSLVATGITATAMTVTGLQVRGSLEDDKIDAIRSARSMGTELDRNNACNDATAKASLPGAQGVIDACDAGRSRAALTNVFLGASIVGALATSFFYYQGYISPSAKTSRESSASQRQQTAPVVRITPTASPTSVGAGLHIEF